MYPLSSCYIHLSGEKKISSHVFVSLSSTSAPMVLISNIKIDRNTCPELIQRRRCKRPITRQNQMLNNAPTRYQHCLQKPSIVDTKRKFQRIDFSSLPKSHGIGNEWKESTRRDAIFISREWADSGSKKKMKKTRNIKVNCLHTQRCSTFQSALIAQSISSFSFSVLR